MDAWIPLFVAVVAGLSALGVAFLNSRGEMSELGQLKAINEALKDMPTMSAETRALGSARDAIALRVAVRTESAPARRKLAWTFVTVGFVLGALVGVVVLLAPHISSAKSAQTWIDVIALVASLVGGILAQVALRRIRRADAAARSRAFDSADL